MNICKNCKHYRELALIRGNFQKHACFHKDFVGELVVDPIDGEKRYKYKPGNCEEINKNGDCKLYEYEKTKTQKYDEEISYVVAVFLFVILGAALAAVVTAVLLQNH